MHAQTNESCLDESIWQDSIREVNIKYPGFAEDILGEKDCNAMLPWDSIDLGIKKEYLMEEYKRYKHSEETPGCQGLGLVKGSVKKLNVENKYPLPHIGWNNIDIKRTDPLFKGIQGDKNFYFVQ